MASKIEHKLDDRAVQSFIKGNLITGIVESHSDEDTSLTIPGFSIIHKPGVKIHAKTKRTYGGVVAYIANSVKSKVIEVSCDIRNMIWLKLSGNFLYLGIVYIHPNEGASSDVWRDMKSFLINDICSNDVVIMGDMNARVGGHSSTNVDVTDETFKELGLEEIRDVGINRFCLRDNKTNGYGRKLLRLCQEASLQNVNGSDAW